MSTTMSLSVQEEECAAGLHGDIQTILVVDNYLWIGELIARGLNSLGYRALTASDGKEAHELILRKGSRHIDLLITELDLPHLRGKELSELFLKENPQGRVLVMSSYSYAADLCKNAAFLKKPFSHESLVAKIDELLAPAGSNSGRHTASNFGNQPA